MLGRTAIRLLLASGMFSVASCESSLKNLRIPLLEDPQAVIVDSPRVTIEDARPHSEQRPHRGRHISSCERWFGDDTFIPSKLEYLDHRAAERTPKGVQVRIRLTHFDTVEYCESSSTGNSTTAGPSAPSFTAAPVVGDTVVLRLAGEVNGVPFDVSSRFDYGTLYWSPHVPSSYPTYRKLLRDRLDEVIDKSLNSVWRAQTSNEGRQRN
jgi:hypothetical protein